MKGQALRRWRVRRKLTTTELADTLGVTRATVFNWETEATPVPKAVELALETLEKRFAPAGAEGGAR